MVRKFNNLRPARGGFTLVELMISIALVLILILGVNQVFKMSAQTVGAGQTLSDAGRDIRAAQAVMNSDFRSWAGDSPAMVINCDSSANSSSKWGFLTRADELSDPDGNALTGNGGAPDAWPAIPSARSFRIDQVGFFAHGLFQRQTGNDPSTFVAPMSSSDAWIWYGHANLINPAATNSYYTPGNGPNKYGASLVLGRTVMLLRAPDSSGNIYDNSSTPITQAYIVGSNVSPITASAHVAPILAAAAAGDGMTAESSRYDLGGTTIYDFGQRVTIATPNSALASMCFRAQCLPQVIKPLSPRGMAQSSPYFVGHVSQFIVEFAGDYARQKGDGTPNNAAGGYDPDGVLDFDWNGTSRQIHWYGLPRYSGGALQASPVRDFIKVQAPFEVTLPTATAQADYRGVAPGSGGFSYVCAFRKGSPNQMPMMVRILMKIDDPGGRIGDGPWTECVFNLQQ